MIKLINFTSTNIFGSVKGREVYQQLNLIIDDSPQVNIFEISFEGIKIIDSSFMRESIVALTKQYSSSKAIYATNISDKDIIDNLDYAAKSKEQAIFLWNKDKYQILGPKITDSAQLLIDLIIKKNGMSTSEISENLNISLQNASNKLKKLFRAGFIFRRQNVAATGGIEYIYIPIK